MLNIQCSIRSPEFPGRRANVFSYRFFGANFRRFAHELLEYKRHVGHRPSPALPSSFPKLAQPVSTQYPLALFPIHNGLPAPPQHRPSTPPFDAALRRQQVLTDLFSVCLSFFVRRRSLAHPCSLFVQGSGWVAHRALTLIFYVSFETSPHLAPPRLAPTPVISSLLYLLASLLAQGLQQISTPVPTSFSPPATRLRSVAACF